MISQLLDKLHLRWSGRAAASAARVERAFADVSKSNVVVTRATLDHADSEGDIRTTIDALITKLNRRELGNDAEPSEK